MDGITPRVFLKTAKNICSWEIFFSGAVGPALHSQMVLGDIEVLKYLDCLDMEISEFVFGIKDGKPSVKFII